MTLSDLEWRDGRGPFSGGFPHLSWYRLTFGILLLTHDGNGFFLGFSHAPVARNHSVPKMRPTTCAHAVWEAATKFCTVIQLDERENVHGRPRPLPWQKRLVTRMLTRDLLVVAKHFVNLSPRKLQSTHFLPLRPWPLTFWTRKEY